MKRIMVIGCCGSGKSTLSIKLGQILGINVFHLDKFYWQENWVEMESSRWKNTVIKLANKSEWIIDGNYGGTMDVRLKRADTILYLDFPTYKCLWRITKRILKYHGKTRPDMARGCKERFDLEFYHYVLTYNMIKRKSILSKLKKLKEEKQIVIFNNDTDTVRYLNQISMKH